MIRLNRLGWTAPVVMMMSLLTTSMVQAELKRVTFVNGDQIQAEVEPVKGRDDLKLINHPIMGKMTVKLDQIKSMTSIKTAAVVAPAPVAPAAKPAPKEEMPWRLLTGWKSDLTISMSGSSGNTEKSRLNFDFKTERKTDEARWLIDSSARFGRSNGKDDEADATVGVKREWLSPDSDYSYFIDGRIEWDNFQDWEYRGSTHVGLGYIFAKTERTKWGVVGGVGLVREFKSLQDEVRPEGQLGVTMDWQISKLQSLVGESTIYPDFKESGEYRLVSKLNWKYRLPEWESTSLSAGLRHEYESSASLPTKKSDFYYTTGLTFDF